jgi:hypothetical protein
MPSWTPIATPVALKPSKGQTHNGGSASGLLDALGADQIVLVDRGYDSDTL